MNRLQNRNQRPFWEQDQEESWFQKASVTIHDVILFLFSAGKLAFIIAFLYIIIRLLLLIVVSFEKLVG